VDDLIAVGERKAVKKSDGDSDDNPRIKMQPTANGISNNTTVSVGQKGLNNLLSFWRRYGASLFTLMLIRIRLFTMVGSGSGFLCSCRFGYSSK
jgi:hypothetical protein